MELTKHSLIEGTEARLLKLAAYLRALPTSGNFDMGSYYDRTCAPGGDIMDREVCGTSACAVGHYAIMEGYNVTPRGVQPVVVTEEWLLKTDRWAEHARMSWGAFSELEIGIPTSEFDTPIFDWLFGSEWENEDNTPEGAAARIAYFLERGVPEDFPTKELSDYPLGEAKKIYAAYLQPTEGE